MTRIQLSGRFHDLPDGMKVEGEDVQYVTYKGAEIRAFEDAQELLVTMPDGSDYKCDSLSAAKYAIDYSQWRKPGRLTLVSHEDWGYWKIFDTQEAAHAYVLAATKDYEDRSHYPDSEWIHFLIEVDGRWLFDEGEFNA